MIRAPDPTAAEQTRQTAVVTKRVNGHDLCTLCGEEVEVPAGTKPQTTIAGASGKRNVRILKVENREIHRCEMSEEESTPHSQMT